MNKLKGYRVMCGSTQEDFAKILGVSRLTYIHKENGVRTFSNQEQQILMVEIRKKLPEVAIEDVFDDDEA